MPTATRVKRRKLTEQSAQNKSAGSSDDEEVVYLGTVQSPQRQRQQEQSEEVIEIGSSSSSERQFSDDGLRQPNRRTKKEVASPSSAQKSHSKRPNEFLTSLFSLLNDSTLSHLISFHVPSRNEPQSQGGGIANRGKIIIHNPDRLQEKIGKYFATSSFDNFRKQLFRYGFRRVHHYGSEGRLRASSYLHDELGPKVESVLDLISLQMRGSVSSEESNKRDRERNYDEVKEIGVQRKDPLVVTADKIQSKGSLRQSLWAAGALDDADLLSNNLKHVSPRMNMPLEILDQDFIWSSAKIIKISDPNSKQSCRVTVRYEGWGSEWDEELPYPNTRLARIFTYTKRVKCLAVLLSKRKEIRGGNTTPNNIRNWTDIWPCTVSFRMPHPGCPADTAEDKKISPEELLRDESNVFVQPYAPHLLPSFLQKKLTWGGWWITIHHLRRWKSFDTNNPQKEDAGGCVLREVSSSESQLLEYHFSKGFLDAYSAAKSDHWVRGCLPPKVTSEGSLVDAKYRVQSIGGDPIEGIRYTGAFDMLSAKSRPVETSSRSTSPVPTTPTKARPLPSIPESPFLRSSTLINYECPGVRRLPNSNRWASIVKISGNDVFLGSFLTQAEAVQARKLALAQISDACAPNPPTSSCIGSRRSSIHQASVATTVVGPIVDLLKTPVEAVVFSFEESNTKAPSFCLHDWVVENDEHFPPQLLMRGMKTSASTKRKQSAPKRN